MKRGNTRLFFVLLLAIIISLSFISASWFSDFFKITGHQVSGDVCENVLLNETTPQFILTYPTAIVFIDADSVKLAVGANETSQLNEGETQSLENGANITINEILFDGQGNNESMVNLTLCQEEEETPSDIDLTVQGITYVDNNTFYVSFCNNGTMASPVNFSIMLENGNYSYATDETLAVPVPGECATSEGIPRDLIHFLPYEDIIIATVDANNSINESNEENNELMVKCFIDGSCLTYVEPSCEDSDFGANLYIKGVTTETDIQFNVVEEDRCEDVNGTAMIREFFCNGTRSISELYSCPWGCQDGACIKRKPIVDFGDVKGYAVDYQTNLFWQRQSSSGKTWNDARTYCEGLNLGGYIDWRLPTWEELKVLYPVSVGEGISGFLGSPIVVGTPGWEVVGYVPDDNALTGVGMRATSGDINRVRLEIRPLIGCTLGSATRSQFGSGLERFIAAPEGYVVTGVGAGCDDYCDITHLSITARKLNSPCSLGEPEIIYSGSRNPERMQYAPEGYIINEVTARAKPGNIRGLTLEYRPIGLVPTDKFLDITIGQNYWTGDRDGGNATILKWIVSGVVPIGDLAPLSNKNSVICVRDGRITPEQMTDVGSCQLCREWKSEGTGIINIFGRLFGISNPTTTKWDCVGFDDTPLLTDFTSDIKDGDTFNLKVGCGDERLTDNCSLQVRYADHDGREDAEWQSVNFNGVVLSTDFVGNVDSNDDFDLKMECENEVIREKCQLCRRYADRNGRVNADWECVALDGTPLLTDFVGDVNADDDFDLKVRCDVEPAPACVDTDNGVDAYVGGVCTDAGGQKTDIVNTSTWVLTEFSCDDNDECVSNQISCPYGYSVSSGGDYCIPKEEKNDAYFVYSKQGDFDISLNELIGTNHELSNVDFRNTRFKMLIDLRLLSATTATTGYSDEMVSSVYDVNSFAQINSIQRHNYESYTDVDKVPETVFEGNRFEIQNIEAANNAFDLSDESANETYIFKEEQLDRYYASGVGLIHSSRHENFGAETIDTEIQTTPTFTSGVWQDDGIVSTYGNGAYAYVDFYGRLYFRYKTQNQNSRAVFSVGILACECSLGEERCDGTNYLSCDDGCSMVNNGEVVGECGVRLTCSDTDTRGEFELGLVTGYENNEVVNRTDVCANESYLLEFSCLENDDVASTEVYCQLGCQDGACIDCIDSDSGKDYSTFGNVLGRDISGELFKNETDRCLGDTLVERVCTNGYADSVFFDCPLSYGGCKNGICQSIECLVNFENTSECGTSNYNVDGVLFCSIANGSKYEFELYNISECELGCSAGVCEVPTCTDYDEGIYDSVTKSNATNSLGQFLIDECSDADTLQEAICVGGELTKEDRDCEFGCSNGRCLGESSCNDTDNGLNYYVKGTSVSCVGDECITGENESCVDGNNLWESYCGRNDEIVWQQFLCPEGCVDGACNIPEERPNATCAPATLGGPEIKPGIRIVVGGQLSYCDPFTLTYQAVKGVDETCINDFECSNNACVDGSCYSVREELQTQREILEEQTSLLQEIRCWLRSLVGVQDYDECLSEYVGG